MLNKAVFLGRLTSDAETKVFDEKKSVSKFTLAVDRDFLNSEGKRDTDFISVSAWNLPQKFTEKYLKKGKLVVVEGRIQTRKWDDTNNVTHYVTELVTDNVYPTQFEKTE